MVATLLEDGACHPSFIEERLAELVHFLNDEICKGDQGVVMMRAEA